MSEETCAESSSSACPLSSSPFFPTLGHFPELDKMEKESNFLPLRSSVEMKDEVSRLKAWVQQVMLAWMRQEPTKLGTQLSLALSWKQPPKASTLQYTGAGRVLNSSFVWSLLPGWRNQTRTELLHKWKQVDRSQQPAEKVRRDPFSGCKPPEFMNLVRNMDVALAYCQDAPAEKEDKRMAIAITLVSCGFTNPAMLEGAAMSVPSMIAVGDPVGMAMVMSLIEKVTEASTSRRTAKFRKLMEVQGEAKQNKQVDLRGFVTSLSAEALELADKKVETLLFNSQVEVSRPRSTVAGVRAAAAKGEDPRKALLERAHQLRLETNRKSLKSVSSGLKCWQAFAESLGYDPNNTVPPVDTDDVLAFVAVFRQAGTARNYVGYLKWCCLTLDLDLSWFKPSVTQALKGLSKQNLRTVALELQKKYKLNTVVLVSVTRLARAVSTEEFRVAFVLGWQFLLRMQSEAVPLEKGGAESVVTLAPERHSAVWLAPNGRLHLRLRTRKHRPAGSLLIRQCICAVGEQHELCPICQCRDFLAGKQEGERLFSFSAVGLLSEFRRMMTLLMQPGARSYGLKAFRAGRATEMALQGCSLPQVLRAGEWSSMAMCNYADEDAFDFGVMLRNAVDQHDED